MTDSHGRNSPGHDWPGHDWRGLRGRPALVAGAGGIGEAVALALARAGARVVVTDRDEARLAALEETRAGSRPWPRTWRSRRRPGRRSTTRPRC